MAQPGIIKRWSQTIYRILYKILSVQLSVQACETYCGGRVCEWVSEYIHIGEKRKRVRTFDIQSMGKPLQQQQ